MFPPTVIIILVCNAIVMLAITFVERRYAKRFHSPYYNLFTRIPMQIASTPTLSTHTLSLAIRYLDPEQYAFDTASQSIFMHMCNTVGRGSRILGRLSIKITSTGPVPIFYWAPWPIIPLLLSPFVILVAFSLPIVSGSQTAPLVLLIVMAFMLFAAFGNAVFFWWKTRSIRQTLEHAIQSAQHEISTTNRQQQSA